MTINKTIDNKVYSIPETGARDWGEDVTELLSKLADVSLQIDGSKQSARPLTADADFGNAFGLIIKYLRSKTGTVSTAGVVRLNKADFIAWRNNVNTANLPLGIDVSDRLTFGGIVIPTTDSTDVLINKSLDADNNNVSNLELDNFKASAITSDLTASASSTQFPRADAAKTYVDAGDALKVSKSGDTMSGPL